MKLSERDEAWLAEKHRKENAADDRALQRAVAVARAELECRKLRLNRTPTKQEYHAATAYAVNKHYEALRAKKNALRNAHRKG